MLVSALVLAVAGSAACSSGHTDSGEPARTPARATAVASTTPTTDATTAPTSAPPARYQPDPAEVDGDAKRVAARAVEALPEVEQVTYTQYFGYLPPEASILVEADFANGQGTTYDVRISQRGGRWRVDSIRAADPAPRLDHPGPLVRRVLAEHNIELPWAAWSDVVSGRVSVSVLRSMLAVAKEHRIAISVLISPHPVNVFGTDRRSNHPDGRAYDIGSIDGHLVVDPAAIGRVRDVMRLAAATGAYQVGGPEDLDGAGSQYFSDATHSDHVHVGFAG